MNDLSQYLEQQRQAGSVESAGSFTLAIEKARDKLGTYSFAQPEEYILKLVQCAVMLKVDELFVELQRNDVLVYFELEATDHSLSVEHLTRSLMSPLDEKVQARSFLSLALCSIAGREPVELMWGDWGGDTDTILSLGHGRSELFRGVPFPRTEPLAAERRLHLLYFKKKSEGIPLSQTSVERTLLAERCCFAPISIHLDGKRLGPHLPAHVSMSDPVRQLTGLYLGALALKSEPSGMLHWPPSGKPAGGLKNRLPAELKPVARGIPPVFQSDLDGGITLPLESESVLSRVYGIPAYLYGRSQIHYVRHGVMLSPTVVHDAGGGAFAILPGTRVKTDLTGLQVIRDEGVEDDISQSVEVWKELVNRFVDGGPPVYHNSLVAWWEDAIDYVLTRLMIGPASRVLRPLHEFVTHKERKRALQLKKLQRQLETRRGYLAFFRGRDDETSPP